MWKKGDSEETERAPARPSDSKPVPRGEPAKSGGHTDRATIGRSITIKGDITGDEDLYIQGSVEGSVRLEQHNVIVGTEGEVTADIHGRTVTVHGKVEGDLFAGEQIILRPSCRVRGNITAPRVTLEDGANFRGMIDMEAKPGGTVSPPPRNASEPSVEPVKDTAEAVPSAPTHRGNENR